MTQTHRLIVQLLFKCWFCSLTIAVTPKIRRLSVSVINKRSFEPFMYLGLVLEP